MGEAKNIMIMARACIKCREYVIIEPNDPKNQVSIKRFEGNHKGHNLVTLGLDEVEGTYKEFEYNVKDI